ncbi:hypothetical protein Hypma_013424 [Hypsizygus marmoreus]|uniref:Late embryogenesis abundant protein LEA-2 subgroup domain-containing protein n=1 Tax=Hypsizygus marmoreus TaxID=39966 RepID=A0A369JDT2_HYPMA|nr:hypothetical protein Hypma_013424 [Hypsizygus marmoreus]
MRLTALLIPVISLFVLCAVGAPAADPLGGLSTQSIIDDLLGLFTQFNAFVSLDTLLSNKISLNFDAKNPLILEYTIDRVVLSAGLNGTEFLAFDQTFTTPVVVPTLGSANSGTFANVALTKGLLNSLSVIPAGVLDVLSGTLTLRVGTVGGQLGLPLPLSFLPQAGVPTAWQITLT